MKALAFGKSNGEIQVVEVPVPVLPSKPKKNQPNLLVKVVAAAIDTGLAAEFPKVEVVDAYFIHSRSSSTLYLGWHFSGIVEKVAEDQDSEDGIKVGTAVFGFLEYSPTQQQGSFAEYILVNSKQCAIKPESVSFELAAASATEAVTALQALRDLGQLSNGKSVLVCGASGGVGSAAVCIAKLLGASKVTAICSDKEVERVRDLFQPDAIINRTTCQGDPIKSCCEQFDIIFDCPSAFASHKYFDCLKPNGTLVETTITSGLVSGFLYSLVTWSSKRVRMVTCEPVRDDLTLIGQWLAEGTLKIVIDSTFHVADMPAAIERQASKEKRGRVVIKVQDGWEKQSK